MSGSVPEPLSRFTPSSGRLDPAAVLFAAGRRSARPNRGWVALASVLAGTQALSLALLCLHPTPHVVDLPGPSAQAPAPMSPEPETTEEPDSTSLWQARHSLLEADPAGRPPSAGTVTTIDSEPPLRGFGPPPPSILN
jgi:hypothetical protein